MQDFGFRPLKREDSLLENLESVIPETEECKSLETEL